MKKYVIYVESGGIRKYVFINTVTGESVGVDSKEAATVLPNRAVAFAVSKAIKPAVRKAKFDAVVGVDFIN